MFTLPKPSDGFEWVQLPAGPVLVCRPVERYASHLFTTRPWQLGAVLFTAFGVLALVVAAIGIYSVVSYTVSQRVHEMGVRIALGARVGDILSLVTGESSRVVGLGVLLGVGAALLLGRLVASLLYGISARDPVILTTSALVLFAIGVAASLVPALRAARVDPVSALRAD